MQKRIAIVGSGISGSLCARLLATEHEVTLLEAANHLGGHTHTVEVEAFDGRWSVDTGFMVFNDRTYPNFIRMLQLLGVDSQASDMSFSVHCERTGLEYQGSSLNGLFAQRANLFRPSFWRMLAGILKFNQHARRLVDQSDEGLTLGEWLERCRDDSTKSEFVPRSVIDEYLLPMTAAIWSAPPQAMAEFPIKFLAHFLQNHGLLQVFDRPQWRTIPGGARHYLHALLHPLGGAVRISSPVESVQRAANGVQLSIRNGESNEIDTEEFDAVVLACHAPQSLGILAEPTEIEQEVLGTFRYQANTAYLHLDQSQLPTRRQAWASWNYRLATEANLPASVTYDLSRLQRVPTPSPLLQTLNPTEEIAPEKVLQTLEFEHPLFDIETFAAQQRHDELHEDGKIFYCGAYWGYGFHEDGVVSALNVCQRFGIKLEDLTKPCIAVCTRAGSST